MTFVEHRCPKEEGQILMWGFTNKIGAYHLKKEKKKNSKLGLMDYKNQLILTKGIVN